MEKHKLATQPQQSICGWHVSVLTMMGGFEKTCMKPISGCGREGKVDKLTPCHHPDRDATAVVKKVQGADNQQLIVERCPLSSLQLSMLAAR